MITLYFSAHNEHIARAVAQGWKPMSFTQFLSLAKHIEAISK
jgi:hypothetical protein